MENRLQGLTINLQEQLESLSSYFEDPDTFDLGSLPYIQKNSERCRDQTVDLLGHLHLRMLSVQQSLQQYTIPKQDDRAKLPSQHQHAAFVERPLSQVSPMTTVNPQSFAKTISPQNSANTVDPQSFAARAAKVDMMPTGRINIPSHYDINIRKETNVPMGIPPGSYNEAKRLSAPRPEAPPRSASESDVALIDSEEVMRHTRSIENFLAKRKRSRVLFQHDLELLRQLSINSTANSTSTTSPRLSVAHPSPQLTYSDDIVASPVQTSRPNSTLLITRSQSRDGHTLSPGGPSNRNSATLSPSPQRQISLDSEAFIFPDSPPISSGRQSLKLPGFGDGVEDGKEVVGQGVSDPGIMLVSEIHDQPTPATSVQSVEYPITHDSSFYRYNGFCTGAKMILQGQNALKVIKKPGV